MFPGVKKRNAKEFFSKQAVWVRTLQPSLSVLPCPKREAQLSLGTLGLFMGGGAALRSQRCFWDENTVDYFPQLRLKDSQLRTFQQYVVAA
ncbi:MAG: hypothetical protein ACO3A2_08435 [Bdellovibrionia bacterium]